MTLQGHHADALGCLCNAKRGVQGGREDKNKESSRQSLHIGSQGDKCMVVILPVE